MFPEDIKELKRHFKSVHELIQTKLHKNEKLFDEIMVKVIKLEVKVDSKRKPIQFSYQKKLFFTIETKLTNKY